MRVIAIIVSTIFLLISCKKDENKVVNHINCDGLVTDTTGTGDTARIYYANALHRIVME